MNGWLKSIEWLGIWRSVGLDLRVRWPEENRTVISHLFVLRVSLANTMNMNVNITSLALCPRSHYSMNACNIFTIINDSILCKKNGFFLPSLHPLLLCGFAAMTDSHTKIRARSFAIIMIFSILLRVAAINLFQFRHP